jgi:hypothetical protein
MKNHPKPLFALLIIAAITAILFGACRKECYLDCTDATTETLSITENIMGVIIDGPWEVSITQADTDNSAEIKYCTSLKNKISTRMLSNGYLHIKITTLNWCGRTNRLVLSATITAAALEKIEASGAADIRTYGHFSSFERISLSGASTVNGLSCKGSSAKIELSGASSIRDFNLSCEGGSAKIKLSGASEIEDFTFTGASIDANLSGSSDVTIDDTTLEYCTVDCSGASSFSCKGYAAETTFTGSGSSTLKTLSLESENLHIDLSGASNADVLVNNKIKGRLAGASTLRYKRAIDVSEVSTSGDSKIIKLD